MNEAKGEIWLSKKIQVFGLATRTVRFVFAVHALIMESRFWSKNIELRTRTSLLSFPISLVAETSKLFINMLHQFFLVKINILSEKILYLYVLLL